MGITLYPITFTSMISVKLFYSPVKEKRLKILQPVKSTAEILAFKAFNKDIDKRWIDWAYNMLLAGYSTEYLVMLAGERENLLISLKCRSW